MPHRVRAIIGVVVSLSVFIAAAIGFRYLVSDLTLAQVFEAIADLGYPRLALSLFCTVLALVILSSYDILAFRYFEYTLETSKIAFASCVGNTVGMVAGFAAITSGSIRLRLYSEWGLRTEQIVKITLFSILTLTVWLIFISGVVLLANANEFSMLLGLTPGILHVIGLLLLFPVMGYIALSLVVPGKSVVLFSHRFTMPSASVAFTQILLSALEAFATAGALYVLLPNEGTPGFFIFFGLFIIAQLTAIASQVPGGIGVFDATILLLLKSYLPGEGVLAALVVFRIIFLFLPVIVALAAFGVFEIRIHAKAAHRYLKVAKKESATVIS